MTRSRPVRILGIDPGSRATGFAILDGSGDSGVVVDLGVIRLGNDLPVKDRLCQLYVRLADIVAEHDPDEVAIEEVFSAANVRSALVLGQARGVALVAAGASRPVFEYSARAVKKAVVGYGQADKRQVAQMVKRLAQLEKVPPQDAADALAVALCHMHSRAIATRLRSVGG